jgi:putative transposase
MARSSAPRLKRTDYIGRRAYLLTICTFQRTPILNSAELVESLLMTFQQCSRVHHFANHAYSFMPDHVHVVPEGERCDSDFCELVRLWKSETAFYFKRTTSLRLWQRGFFDRALRDHDEMMAFARYVIENPRRAGLSEERRRYPFVGSDTTTIEEILRGELPRRQFSKFVR